MNNETMSSAVGIPDKRPHPARWLWRLVGRIRYWMFLNVWCRHLYRPTMRVMHRFNLHYAPPSPMNPRFGEQHHWCQWCGLRGTTYKYDPAAPLRVLTPNITMSQPGGQS
jgi:hypothetical protein